MCGSRDAACAKQCAEAWAKSHYTKRHRPTSLLVPLLCDKAIK